MFILKNYSKYSNLLGFFILFVTATSLMIGCDENSQSNTNENTITASCIGHMGRFGNQIYQYLFLKLYAKRHGLNIQTPNWIGNSIFGLVDPRISISFPVMEESQDLVDSYTKKTNNVYSKVDFKGYFQVHTSLYADEKEYIQSILEPTDFIKSRMKPAMNDLKSRGHTLVVIHLRRGDFGAPPFLISPATWYIQWLQKTLPNLDHPIIYLASDSLELVLPDFEAAFGKVYTSRDLNVTFDDKEMDSFLVDYYLITQAQVFAASNSSFSTSAALLNKAELPGSANQNRFFKPDFSSQKLVPFDPWDTLPFEHLN